MMRTTKTFSIIFVAVIASFLGHEGAHYIAGRALGHPMGMTMNSTYNLDNGVDQEDAILIDAAGPLFSILQALFALWLLRWTHRSLWYPFVLVPAFMRILATVVTINNPNDEARIGIALGLGTYTLPLIVSCLCIGIVLLAANQLKMPRSRYALNIVSVIVFSSALILLDQALS